MARRIFSELKTSVPFWICFVVSIGLEAAGFVVPPMGVIDGSVLKGVGLLLAFPTLWCVYQAIEKGIDAKITLGNTKLEIGDFSRTDPQPRDPETP